MIYIHYKSNAIIYLQLSHAPSLVRFYNAFSPIAFNISTNDKSVWRTIIIIEPLVSRSWAK